MKIRDRVTIHKMMAWPKWYGLRPVPHGMWLNWGNTVYEIRFQHKRGEGGK